MNEKDLICAEYDEIDSGENSKTSDFKHGKFEQQKYLSKEFAITDEQLEQFLVINFAHLGLPRGKDQDEDVSLISWYTMNRFMVALDIFSEMGMITALDNAVVIPYIINIVNENSPRISLEPKGFKGKLYAPQASLLKRMLDIELSPPSFLMKHDEMMTINGGLITERLSFGKTFCLPALICERFMPYESNRDGLIHTNLIICGTKVAKEWKNNLKKFTSFTFQVIEKASDFNSLESSLLDVIVVKDGDITWKGKKAKALEHTLELFRGKVFARVIYDDYDMLKLKPGSSVPEALFTWFISGTDSDNVPNINFHYFIDGQKKYTLVRSIKPILNGVASIKCNREYSIVEYNIPKIDSFYIRPNQRRFNASITPLQLIFGSAGSSESLLSLVQKIVSNESIDYGKKNSYFDPSLFTGTKDVPYIYDRARVKILVAIEDKQEQIELVNALNESGIKAVKLTRANVDKFSREDATVCVAGNLFGVNMGFLTHIIIDVEGFTSSSFTQIIGRGQRLSRKQNLQVYFYEKIYEDASDAELKF